MLLVSAYLVILGIFFYGASVTADEFNYDRFSTILIVIASFVLVAGIVLFVFYGLPIEIFHLDTIISNMIKGE
jgi:hypothetical protein